MTKWSLYLQFCEGGETVIQEHFNVRLGFYLEKTWELVAESTSINVFDSSARVTWLLTGSSIYSFSLPHAVPLGLVEAHHPEPCGLSSVMSA